MVWNESFAMAATGGHGFPAGLPKDRLIPEALLEQAVLVIEDEAMIAWTIETMLEDLGFANIMIVASGEDAVRRTQSVRPGMIISDVNLGRGAMDGISASTEICRDLSPIVIFVSGFVSREAKQRIGLSFAHAKILSKPIGPEDLRRVIIEAVERVAKH